MKKFTTYDIAFVGVMAAIVFTLTYFVSFPIPTATGTTMIKTANAFCLIGGILLGGVKGGLAAGLGSMLYDLSNPAFVSSAPTTFVFFFLMAFVCGTVANRKIDDENPLTQERVVLASVCGAFTYVALYVTKSIITQIIAARGLTEELFTPGIVDQFKVAFTAVLPKFATSCFNACVAIVITGLIALPIKQQISKTSMYNKILAK